MQAQGTGRGPVFSLLRDTNYRHFWYVGGLTWTSFGLELLVLSWFVLLETDSPFRVALVLVFFILPWPLFNLFTGAMADRFNRRYILLAAQTINILAVIGFLTLVLSDRVEPWHVYVVAMFEGTARALEFPSRRTTILDITGEGQIVNAVSLDVVLNTTGRMTGPLLGGILLSFVGLGGAYSVALALHVLAMLFLVQVKIPRSGGSVARGQIWGSLVTTIKYAVHSPVLLGTLYITIIINGLGFPVQQFVTVIGRDELGVGPALVGLLAAAIGFGQLIGAGVLASTRGLRNLGPIFVAGSFGILVMALLFVWSPWYTLSFVLLTGAGMGAAGFETMQSTITMLTPPQAVRGGMMGLMSTGIGVGIVLGTLGAGALASILDDTRLAITIIASAGVLLFLPAMAISPLTRPLKREPQPDTVPPPGSSDAA